MAAGRIGSAWRRARAQVFATESMCWLCGEWVDQTLDRRHPMSRTADHVVPLNRGGHPTARTNLRLAHRRCNGRKGDGPKERHVSARW